MLRNGMPVACRLAAWHAGRLGLEVGALRRSQYAQAGGTQARRGGGHTPNRGEAPLHPPSGGGGDPSLAVPSAPLWGLSPDFLAIVKECKLPVSPNSRQKISLAKTLVARVPLLAPRAELVPRLVPSTMGEVLCLQAPQPVLQRVELPLTGTWPAAHRMHGALLDELCSPPLQLSDTKAAHAAEHDNAHSDT